MASKASKKVGTTTTKKQYKPSQPSVGENGKLLIRLLNLEAIVRAVRISRELTSIDGARIRWGWHPLFLDAVTVLDRTDDLTNLVP